MQIVKNSVIYLGSSILSKSIPFLLLPILTKYLSPAEYGTLSIFLIFISIYGAFVGMALHTNIAKNYYKVERNELAKIIGNILFILSITLMIYFLLTFGIYTQFDTVFSIPTELLLIVPFIAFMQMINNLNTTILRNEQRAYMFGVFEVSLTAVIMSVTILSLVVLGFGWYSQVVGVFVAGVVFSIIGFVYMSKRSYITLAFDKDKIKSILNISIPLIPHVLGGLIIAASDRLFIEQMVSLEAVGLYAVGYSFGMIVMLFTDAFIKAWSPWFYKNLANPTDSKKVKIVKYTYVFIIGLFVLAGLISVVAEFMLPYFVDEKFYGASEFIFWVALGYAVRGVYQIFFPYLVHISRTSFLAVSTVVAALINLALNYVLIDIYGAIGAAYATVGAYAVSALLVFCYQQRNYYMPWFLRVKIEK
ncbi:oligosaccharide flippase family protein [Aliarcobacter skirrowii]|uniref:oligosaccharide flippase family protein n=1 Tax=Aliarcobacter skirrowii TaxID=28200 RepID=UPI00082FC24C|nr:oligosaccharide flippase family protein [Aliarcobacter skirrowii]